MSKSKFSWRHLASLMLLAFTMLTCTISAANAQSGRKIPKTPTKPPETTQPKPPEETPATKPSPKEPQIPVLVTYQLQTIFNSHIYSSYVAQGCLERLNKAIGMKGQFGREMNRKEASDFAKASTDVYVLWFELESDAFNSSTSNRNDIQSMYVNYVLYAPTTGKINNSGHIYMDQRGGLTQQIPRNVMTAEYLLRRTGSDLADRVFKVLNLPLPPDRF